MKPESLSAKIVARDLHYALIEEYKVSSASEVRDLILKHVSLLLPTWYPVTEEPTEEGEYLLEVMHADGSISKGTDYWEEKWRESSAYDCPYVVLKWTYLPLYGIEKPIPQQRKISNEHT